MIAAHCLGLEPARGCEFFGRRVRFAKLAAKPRERGVVPFPGEILAVPVGVDLVSSAMSAEQGEQIPLRQFESLRDNLPSGIAGAIEPGRVEERFRFSIEVGETRNHGRPPGVGCSDAARVRQCLRAN